mgnify:FL=1
MSDSIQWTRNTMPAGRERYREIMSLDHAAKARAFHQSFPQYTVTPPARLDGMAQHLAGCT